MFCRGLSLFFIVTAFFSGLSFANDGNDPDAAERKLVIHANADSFFVELNNRFHYVASGDTLAFTGRLTRFTVIAVGRREKAISYSRALGLLQSFQLWLEPDKHPERSRYMMLKTGDNVVIHTAPQTRILIDGEAVGMGMFRSAKPPGHYQVKLVNPDGLTRRVNLKVKEDRLTYLPRTVNPNRKTTKVLSYLPGVAQFRKHEPVKGISIQLLFAAGLAGTYLSHQHFLDSRVEFRNVREIYRLAGNDNMAFELGEEMDRAAAVANRYSLARNLIAGASVLLYVYNIWDGFRPPPGGFEHIDRINPWVDYQKNTGVAAGLTYSWNL